MKTMSRWFADAIRHMPMTAPKSKTKKSAESSRSGMPVIRVKQVSSSSAAMRKRRTKAVRPSQTNMPLKAESWLVLSADMNDCHWVHDSHSPTAANPRAT